MSDEAQFHHEVMAQLEQSEFKAAIEAKYPQILATWPGRTNMSDLLKINVNTHVEKKGQLSYLSWAWAWAEVLKVDPSATWVVHTYGPQGSEQPCMWIGDTAMVHTSVTVKGLRRECMLPVMDHKNNAMKSPDARKISDAIMRCMTKGISMHGLGLYIYAGEDLPEGEEAPAKPHSAVPDGFRSSPTMGAMDELPAEQQEYIRELAQEVMGAFSLTNGSAHEDREQAVRKVEAEQLDDSQKVALWSQLDSKTRSAFKAVQATMKEAA